MKKLLYPLPEIFFIGLALYWIQDNYTASGSINYFAIGVIAVMVFQLIFSNKFVGIASGIILGIFSMFMVLAVRSEHNDFPAGSSEGLTFLLLGEGLFFLSIIVAGCMVFKFVIQKPKQLYVQNTVS
jgi:hypothetical protein